MMLAKRAISAAISVFLAGESGAVGKCIKACEGET